jgi:hypothetical protein
VSSSAVEWPVPGVVDQDVDPAEGLGQLVDHVGGLGQRGEVDVPDLGAAAQRAHLLGRGLGGLLLAVPGDADVAAGPASATAVARPMPDSEPVTMATRGAGPVMRRR